MILKDFYKILSLQNISDTNFDVMIELNPNHAIMKGHFPNNPITPGVCMMQIIKDVAEEISANKLALKSCNNVKFMALINPNINPILKLNLDIMAKEDGIITVKNVTKFDDTVALKLSNSYQII